MLITRLKKSIFGNYQYLEHYLNLRIATFLVVLAISLSSAGFMWIEHYTFIEALYMSVIMISTVGFTEVNPLSPNGQVFASVMILMNIGIYAYSIAAFTQFIIHGELFKALHINAMKDDILQLNHHIILCGYGKYGKEIATQLINNQVDFIVIEKDKEEILNIQNDSSKIHYIHDDATQDEVLERAGIRKAKALICALPEDADNVFTVLTARQLNKDLNIVSRAKDPRTEKKLIMAGANHVILPEQIGGFHMATLVLNPNAINFFSSLIKASEKNLQIKSFEYKNIREAFRDKSLYEIGIRQKTGVNVIALQTKEGYFISPTVERLLSEDECYIVLGNPQQIQSFRKHFIDENHFNH